MPGRFNLGPLAHAVGDGLRHRASVGTEAKDRTTRAVLVLLPATGVILSLTLGVELSGADQLIAGFALLAGTSIAAFTQLAAWREKLTARAKKVDGVASRALDEAVAHVLMIVVVSMAATVAMVIVFNIEPGEDPSAAVQWTIRGFSAAGIGAGLYVVLSLVIVVNLLFDAYTNANPRAAIVEDSGADDLKSA